jgi:hypothetical protein
MLLEEPAHWSLLALSGIGDPELLSSNQVSDSPLSEGFHAAPVRPSEVVEMQQFSEQKQGCQQLHP